MPCVGGYSSIIVAFSSLRTGGACLREKCRESVGIRRECVIFYIYYIHYHCHRCYIVAIIVGGVGMVPGPMWTPWFPMETPQGPHGHPMGTPWGPMGRGDPWGSMGTHGPQRGHYGDPYGDPILWVLMAIHGDVGGSCTHGTQRGPHGIAMVTSWESHRPHGVSMGNWAESLAKSGEH